MKTFKEIKICAKQLVSGKSYWPSVLVTFLATAIISTASGIVSATGVGSIVVSIFLSTLTLGALSYFLCLYNGISFNAGDAVKELFTKAFPNDYIKKVGGLAWMTLWVFLWSLLFVIPGIIKSFSYAMTPYILLNRPDISPKEALKASMKIMDGHKADLFMLYLSFIGWYILSALTGGLLYVFYVGPYIECSLAIFYDEIYKDAAQKGIV